MMGRGKRRVRISARTKKSGQDGQATYEQDEGYQRTYAGEVLGLFPCVWTELS